MRADEATSFGQRIAEIVSLPLDQNDRRTVYWPGGGMVIAVTIAMQAPDTWGLIPPFLPLSVSEKLVLTIVSWNH